MFNQLGNPQPTRSRAVLGASLAAHLLFMAWILHSPPPIFVAPVSMAKGAAGQSLTRIYFGGEEGITQQKPKPKIELPKSAKGQRTITLPPIAAKKQSGNELSALSRKDGPPAGSLYGSLSVGSFYGSEIRPALPVVSPDPALDPEVAHTTSGDIVVEVTIDEAGNIVEKKIIQSLGPSIDPIVMATLERWHFMPATKNGVPIPSKQDVYYHFPR